MQMHVWVIFAPSPMQQQSWQVMLSQRQIQYMHWNRFCSDKLVFSKTKQNFIPKLTVLLGLLVKNYLKSDLSFSIHIITVSLFSMNGLWLLFISLGGGERGKGKSLYSLLSLAVSTSKSSSCSNVNPWSFSLLVLLLVKQKKSKNQPQDFVIIISCNPCPFLVCLMEETKRFMSTEYKEKTEMQQIFIILLTLTKPANYKAVSCLERIQIHIEMPTENI